MEIEKSEKQESTQTGHQPGTRHTHAYTHAPFPHALSMKYLNCLEAPKGTNGLGQAGFVSSLFVKYCMLAYCVALLQAFPFNSAVSSLLSGLKNEQRKGVVAVFDARQPPHCCRANRPLVNHNTSVKTEIRKRSEKERKKAGAEQKLLCIYTLTSYLCRSGAISVRLARTLTHVLCAHACCNA